MTIFELRRQLQPLVGRPPHPLRFRWKCRRHIDRPAEPTPDRLRLVEGTINSRLVLAGVGRVQAAPKQKIPLFADVPAEMTEEEREIGRSSPMYADDFAPPTPAAAG